MTSVPPVADSKILGVVLLMRHGDREGFYQDPVTYTATNTAITPLGNAQAFMQGQQIRNIYLNASSSHYISTISNSIVEDDQVNILADGGGERGVIFNSALSFLQGLYPATLSYTDTLANGTTVVGPLGGYQTVPIATVNPSNDVSLEGYTNCNTFTAATTEFYKSAAFQAVAAEHADFLGSLQPFLDGRAATLENMYNVFDYMSVQSAHNATFAKNLPPTFLARARALADFHENGVFTSPSPTGPGNIAGRTILPSILSGISGIADASNPTKLQLEAIAYKPFISLFNMTGVAAMSPQLYGIVEFTATAGFEVWQPNAGGEPVVRFVFKNGTQDEFRAYPFLNSTDPVPVSTVLSTLTPMGVADTPTWCSVCANDVDRGCGMLAAAAASASTAALASAPHHKISPVGAGFIGACVTLAVLLGSIAALSVAGLVSFGKKKPARRYYDNGSETGSEYKQ